MNKIFIIYFIFILLIILCTIKITKQIHFENYEYTIPKIVWSYWSTDNFENIPLSVKQILIDRNKKLESKNWQVNMIDNSNINQYINQNEYPLNYNKLGVEHQSDWIRLKLLQKYSGLWMDASIIINNIEKLEEMYQDSLQYKSELTGFYLKGFTMNDDNTTYIENWFIMVPKNDNIINSWLDEFETAIDMGFDNYVNKIKSTGYVNDGIYRFGSYLTQHLCLQIVLQKIDNKPKLLLYNADDSMFKLHIICEWKYECIKHKLLNDKTIKNIPFIKLRGNDRLDDMKLYFNTYENYINEPYITVTVNTGLCNRLRVILSHLYKANQENKKLKFLWVINDDCPGRFDEIFKDIENVEIVYTDEIDNTDYNTVWEQNWEYKDNNYYNLLKPIDKIQNQIDHIIDLLNNKYIACHIRRTDMLQHNWFTDIMVTDDEYINYINSFSDDYNIYIATDCQKTQQKFLNLYGDRIVHKKIENFNLRQTSLEHAVIDLYVCANADYFIGSKNSTFTNVIEDLANVRK